MTSAIPENDLFDAYAKICLHLGKVPTTAELRIASRELQLKSHNAYTKRYGSIKVMQQRFKEWLQQGHSQNKQILKFEGWSETRVRLNTRTEEEGLKKPEGHLPFLPLSLADLDQLSRGEKPGPCFEENVNTAFERRCAEAFRCLGFEVEQLGQGKGRKADCLAVARQDRFAVIIDAKVRRNGYVLGTEDRKFLEYSITHTRELHRTGLQNVYFAVIGSEFQNDDLEKAN